MKKGKILVVGLIGLLMAGGLVLAGCDDGKDDKKKNPFIGTWSGTVKFGGQSANATIIATDSSWTFNCPDAYMSEAGTYTWSEKQATLRQEGVTFGTATISGNTLTVIITSYEYQGGTGTFTK
jgi:hypothetical protein